MTSSTTDFAEIALGNAMAHLEQSARPWPVHPQDLTRLKEDFRRDFEKEILDLPKYQYWKYAIERLFTLVGQLAVFVAEAHRQDIGHPPDFLERDDLVLACQLVRLFVCPVDDSDSVSSADIRGRAKVCRLVPFFQEIEFMQVSASIKAILSTLPRG